MADKSFVCSVDSCDCSFSSENKLNGHIGGAHPDKINSSGCKYCSKKTSGSNKFCSTECYGKYQKSTTPAKHYLRSGHGYEKWDADNTSITVHGLLAISKGADPYKVYGDLNYNVDHINGCKIDNRPQNIKLMDSSDHGRKDGGKWKKYNHMDVLEMVSRFVEETEISINEAMKIVNDGSS